MEDEDDAPLSHILKMPPQRTYSLGRGSSASASPKRTYSLGGGSSASASPSPKYTRSRSGNTSKKDGKGRSPYRVSRKGDLVWAKAFPYTWWPGKIEGFHGHLVLVSFFGCSRTRLFDPSDIRSFEESFPQVVKLIRVKLSEEIDLALNEFTKVISTGLKCHCRVSSAGENGSLAVKRRFDSLGILDFVMDKAVSPQFAYEEMATIARVSAGIITFRNSLSIFKASELDEGFCAESLLDFVGDVAISPGTFDMEIDAFGKSVAQLNAFRKFTSMKLDGFYWASWEPMNITLESGSGQAYLGQLDYTSEDAICQEKTADSEVDVSTEPQTECQLLKVNHEQDREKCVINMLNFNMDANCESKIYDHNQVDTDLGQLAGINNCINSEHRNILHSYMEDVSVKLEVDGELQGYTNFPYVNDTEEAASSSICTSVADKFAIISPFNYPSHMLQLGKVDTFNRSIVASLETVKRDGTDKPIHSDKYNSEEMLLQQTIHMSEGKLNRLPINNVNACFCGEKHDSLICDRHQVDTDLEQSASRSLLHSGMESASVRLDAESEVQSYTNFSLLGKTNDITVSSICAVQNKLLIMSPNLLLQAGEVDFNRFIVENKDSVSHESTDIPKYCDKYNSAETLLQHTMPLSGGQLNLSNNPQSKEDINFNTSNTSQFTNEIPQMVSYANIDLPIPCKRKLYEITESYQSPKTYASQSRKILLSGSLLGKSNSAQVSNEKNKVLFQDNIEADASKLGFGNQQCISKVQNESCHDMNVSCKLYNSDCSTSSQISDYQSKWQSFYAAPLIKDGLSSAHKRLQSFESNNCSTPKKNLTVKFPKETSNCNNSKKSSMKFPKDTSIRSTPRKKLTMKFPKNFSLPSKDELEKKFRVFGPLDNRRTQIFFYTGVGQVVFLHQADAIMAYKYVTKKDIFGQAIVRFWLTKSESNKNECTNVPGTVLSSQNAKPCLENFTTPRAENIKKADSNIPGAIHYSPNIKSCLKKSSIPQLIDERKGKRVKFSVDL